MLRRVTGWDVTAEELHSVARRIVTAKKLYNLREGWTADEDTLPKRFLSEGLPVGADAVATLPRERLTAMIAAYYAARGWDAAGRVPASLAGELGLHDWASFS
jgi:aldehyde:ferredoxin oxidoreductase